jgi:hypothetical protein
MESNSDESENSPEVQNILGEALRSSKRLATLMSIKEFQASGSGYEQAKNQQRLKVLNSLQTIWQICWRFLCHILLS